MVLISKSVNRLMLESRPKHVLTLKPDGHVRFEDLQTYIEARQQAVAERLAKMMDNIVVQRWFADFTEEFALYKEDGVSYLGAASSEQQTKAALQQAKATSKASEIIAAMIDFILFFCGFDANNNAKCLTNAVHFQYAVNVQQLLSMTIPPPSADDASRQICKINF